MKKKFFVISLCINLIAGLFIMYSFIPKEKKVGDEGGSGYVFVWVDRSAHLLVTDGINDLDSKELNPATSKKNLKENQINISKELNDYCSKGYEITSSINTIFGSNYVLKKK